MPADVRDILIGVDRVKETYLGKLGIYHNNVNLFRVRQKLDIHIQFISDTLEVVPDITDG
jgi:hypothetical protein